MGCQAALASTRILNQLPTASIVQGLTVVLSFRVDLHQQEDQRWAELPWNRLQHCIGRRQNADSSRFPGGGYRRGPKATRNSGYDPVESENKIKGGNSNWRGPIWFPATFLIIESLRTFGAACGDMYGAK